MNNGACPKIASPILNTGKLIIKNGFDTDSRIGLSTKAFKVSPYMISNDKPRLIPVKKIPFLPKPVFFLLMPIFFNPEIFFTFATTSISDIISKLSKRIFSKCIGQFNTLYSWFINCI